MKKMFLGMCLLTLIAMEGCKKSDEQPCTAQVSAETINAIDQTQLQKDIATIDNYLAANAITATKHSSGLRYVISTAGDDSRPCLESNVSVKYSGQFFNGSVFDSSVAPISFQLNKLILGWQIGFTDFGKGTKVTLYVPSGFGYGVKGATSIPPNTNLVFYIELLDF